jgi:hypothetical protein
MKTIFAYARNVGAIIKDDNKKYYQSSFSNPSRLKSISEEQALAYIWKWGYESCEPEITLGFSENWLDKIRSAKLAD